MKFQQIRNATVILNFGGKKFLIDPFLAEKDSIPSFPFTNNDRKNPMVELPVTIEELLNVDAVIVTHLHPDHFDEAAIHALPKDILLFAKDEEEVTTIRGYGFTNVQLFTTEGTNFDGVTIYQTRALHGSGELVVGYMHGLGITEKASGIVFKHPDEKVLYIAGDTIWFDGVQEALDNHTPDIIVLNAGDAQFIEGGSIIMGTKDVYATYQAAPNAQYIISHMEAVNHAQLTRKELATFLDEKGISANFLIPDDGESFSL